MLLDGLKYIKKISMLSIKHFMKIILRVLLKMPVKLARIFIMLAYVIEAFLKIVKILKKGHMV